jgi:hypothetical protein
MQINICFIFQGNALKQSVVDIERFPRTGVDEHTLNNFLGVSRHQSKIKCHVRCGCRTSAVD